MLSMKTPDEVARFLRDLCTLPELEALAHRWRTVQLLEEGVPYVEIAERVPTSTATVTRVAQWLRHGTGGYRTALDRTRRRPEGDAREPRCPRGRPRRRAAQARRPREGAHVRAVAPALRRRRALVRGHRALADRPVRERAGRSAPRPPERHPRVRRRTASCTRGSPARTSSSSPRRRCTSRRSPSSGSAAARSRSRCRRRARTRQIADLDGRRIATSYLVSTRRAPGRARRHRRARPRLRLGRGDAAARARRRDRRSRLHRLDDRRQRASPHGGAALVAGRADRAARTRSTTGPSSSTGCG